MTISRAAGTLTFPANFQLIAAMNPCPCGYWGDPTHNCTCSPAMVTRYQKRISGPLLDPFDIHAEVPVEQASIRPPQLDRPLALMEAHLSKVCKGGKL